MLQDFRYVVSLLISTSLLLSTPVPLFADGPILPFIGPPKIVPSVPAASSSTPSQLEMTNFQNDLQLTYWGKLSEENPLVAEFALGEPLSEQPLWKVEGSNPLLDQDPFFMRSQSWSESSDTSASACQGLCYKKDAAGVTFTVSGQSLTLRQPLTPIFETDAYILMSADNLELFKAKVDGESEPGEGLFFIRKDDIEGAFAYKAGVPVFYFPLPGPGWTGENKNAFELATANQVVVYNHDNFGMPIDLIDFQRMEQIERNNLVIAQTWSLLEGAVASNGVALPRPNTTLAFGVFLSGQLPDSKGFSGASHQSQKKFEKLAHVLSRQVLPVAQADEKKPTTFQLLKKMYVERKQEIAQEEALALAERVKAKGIQWALPLNMDPLPKSTPSVAKQSAKSSSDWMTSFFSKWFPGGKKENPQGELNLTAPDQKEGAKASWLSRLAAKLKPWTTPAVLYGAKFGAAAAIGTQIDWSALITADMPQRIMSVGALFGSVLAASVILKYTAHKAIFDKKYPKTPDETMLQRLNKEHKGILDELTHGLWFATACIPQGIRHSLDFLKDRFFPNNKTLHKAWEATMGFQMRQSSRLAMNWKTFYLGSIVFGMADAIQVLVDLVIIVPFLAHVFGFESAFGATTAAFVSATVLSQFVGYLQSGAHSYSADVKMIHLKSAQDEAKRQMIAQGLNPEAAKNDGLRNRLTAIEMEKRFKIVGLPGKDEFLYDPITTLEDVMRRAGFAVADIDKLSEEEKAKLASQDFVLKRRRWGLVKPSLSRALATARAAQNQSPSPMGAKVVQLLEWAQNNRQISKSIAGRAWDIVGSSWGAEGLQQSMADSLAEFLKGTSAPTPFAAMKASMRGAIRYLAEDSTQEARDIRSVLFLMSTSGSALDMKKYLPKSWIEKAGSEEAAVLGAELFHRSFYGYMDHDTNLIQPDAKLTAEYGARVEAIMARIDRRNPTLLADPFARQIRSQELMSRLQRKDKERKAVLEYEPPALSLYEQRQWRIAREKAEIRLRSQADTDAQVTSEWLGVAERYSEKSGEEVADVSEWARSHKYRTIVAQEIARRSGLVVEDFEKSEFVQKVVVEAAIQTDGQLALTNEKIYMDSLSDEDREFYQAQLFSRNFINSYVDMSVRSDEHLSGKSPEFPGAGQKIRRFLVGKPGGEYGSAVVRTIEAFFRNEESSFLPTLSGYVERVLPFFPDLYHNFVRNLRIMPYVFTLSYLTNYYVWQIHIPYPMWVVGFLLGFTHSSMVEWNGRIMRNFDIKPMEDVPSKLTYAFMHSLLTNPQAAFEMIYAQTIGDAVDKYMVKPIENGLAACEELLSGAHSQMAVELHPALVKGHEETIRPVTPEPRQPDDKAFPFGVHKK